MCPGEARDRHLFFSRPALQALKFLLIHGTRHALSLAEAEQAPLAMRSPAAPRPLSAGRKAGVDQSTWRGAVEPTHQAPGSLLPSLKLSLGPQGLDLWVRRRDCLYAPPTKGPSVRADQQTRCWEAPGGATDHAAD